MSKPNESPIIANEKLEDAASIVEELLQLKAFEDVIDATIQLELRYPDEPRFPLLRGVAYGSLGKHESALKAFLKTLEHGWNESAIINVITSDLALGRRTLALRTMEKFFPLLSHEGQNLLMTSVLEGLRTFVISRNELPEQIRTRLTNVRNIRT